MSATVSSGPDRAGSATSRSGGSGRWRWPVLIALLVLLGAVLAASLTRVSRPGELDLDSAYPTGSRALAQILRQQGVKVRQVTTVDGVSGADADTTVAVVSPDVLGPRELDRLAALPADLVLIEPNLQTLAALAPFAQVAGRKPTGGPVPPQCQDPDAEAAGEITGGGALYRGTGSQTALCYPQDSGTEENPGSLIQGQDRGHRVTILGQAALVQNDHLNTEGNAALALRVLGKQDTLLWFRPDPLALSPDSAPTLTELLPSWVRWVPAQLLITIMVVIVWRARRFGPLVTEPLPVVVRAAETQEGRARLYRQVRARDRTAATLRTATARRLIARLNLPVDAGADQVSTALSTLTGLPARGISQVLFGPQPADDAQLLQLATDLDVLERSVTRDGTPAGPAPPGDTAPSVDPTTAKKAENT